VPRLTLSKSIPRRSQRARTVAPTVDEEALLEQFAFEFGRSYDSYLVTEPGRQCFWSTGRCGVVVYVQVGRSLHVGGGLLAPEEHKENLLAEFVRFANQQRRTIAFYNIADDDLPLFTQLGFQVTKWGEDALVQLRSRNWSGKSFEWVRRQSSFCLRHGLCWSECIPRRMAATQWNALVAELRDISAARLATKPQVSEIGFLDGRFDPQRLGRRRLFIARSLHRVEGFLVANPCLNGKQWALETYRHRPDAVRGTIAFLMHQTMHQLQHEGVDIASLCLVPGLRCSEPRPGDSRIIRWGLKISQHLNVIFDHAGLYHFKSRFRPQFENRYVCSFPKATLGSFCAFMRLSGVLDLSLGKLFFGFCSHLKKSARRATLARPER
jgi:phosphatidylglycerol lysyltransferase